MGTAQEAKALADKLSETRGDLQVFSAIQVLTEGGMFSAGSQEAERQISQICGRELRRLVRQHDRLIGKIGEVSSPPLSNPSASKEN